MAGVERSEELAGPRSYRIPWARPYLDEDEVDAVVSLLRARRLSLGSEVDAFEREIAQVVGRRHACAVSNGSVALDLALKLVGVRDGDEVLVSSLAYVATTNAIVLQRATPVFCDVDPATLNIDPEDVARRIGKRAKALLVADYCGSPAEYAQLEAICDEHGLALLVDGAQSIFSLYRGRHVCSYGRVATLSFHSAKPIVTGEGGMLVADEEHLDQLGRRLRGQGEVRGRKYVHDVLAHNYRLTEIAAAIGRAQLRRATEIAKRREALAERYAAGFAAVPAVRTVAHVPGTRSTWFSYPILVPDRDRVAARLASDGIETRSLYPIPAYKQPIAEYRRFAFERRPNAEAAAAAVLNLPIFFEMTFDQVDEVVESVTGAVGGVPGVSGRGAAPA